MSGRLGDTSPFIKRQGIHGKCIDQGRVDNYPKEVGFGGIKG
jgi:hypothetical protein